MPRTATAPISSQLFAPKPKDEQGSSGKDGSASSASNGASRSLQYLADANAKGQAAPQDQAAQSASASAADASASAPAAPPMKNGNNLAGATAKLKTDHKIGVLGSASGSGGTASVPGGGNNASSLLAKGGSLASMGASRGGGLGAVVRGARAGF